MCKAGAKQPSAAVAQCALVLATGLQRRGQDFHQKTCRKSMTVCRGTATLLFACVQPTKRPMFVYVVVPSLLLFSEQHVLANEQ